MNTALFKDFCGVLQLLHIVEALAGTGHFTVVAVTRPLEFEGRVKVEAADRLLNALDGTAHLVTVIEQVKSVPYLKLLKLSAFFPTTHLQPMSSR
jgi:hypothetical protein